MTSRLLLSTKPSPFSSPPPTGFFYFIEIFIILIARARNIIFIKIIV
jgi:hypothetical protein